MVSTWADLESASEISFVIGSGPSVENFDKHFLNNLMDFGTVFGVNNVAVDIPCHYNVRKSFGAETRMPEELPEYRYANPECKLIISEYDCGDISRGLLNTQIIGDYYYFSHGQNKSMGEINWPEGDQIVVSWSTITSALHLAASLGTKVIYVIGNDLRGSNYSGYPSAPGPAYWQFRSQSIEVKERLRQEFGCSVVTLSPFSGLGFVSDRVSRTRKILGKIQYFLKFHIFDRWRF